jgi:acetylornithine deacetylase/succinyl-diaminopimelate desuccinylase-like protein
MRLRESLIVGAAILSSACACASGQAVNSDAGTPPQLNRADRTLAHDVFRELIETNTTDSVGNVTTAAQEMRVRLLAAGFAPGDVVLAGPNARKQNLVARLRGKPNSGKKPVLIIGHIDVVEARREDWTPGLDPFKLTEKDGYFYGRGTQDMKNSDTAAVVSLIRMKREGYVPDRDIILALTADEEGGKSNGVDWLLKNRRNLIEAGFALNPDSGGLLLEHGKPIVLGVEATEKLYADYHVTALNPGGHSSLPTANNAIYHVADALGKLQQYRFPFELDDVTRVSFKNMALIEGKNGRQNIAAQISSMLATPPDMAAADKLATDPEYNSLMRTTCVATTMSAGHAPNALPERATANVNCRIFPGHSQEEIRQQLIRIFADPTLSVDYVTDAGEVLGKGSDRASMKPPPLNPEVFGALDRTVAQMWPGISVLPQMEAGSTDSIYTMAAGIPSYGFSGMGIEEGDFRAHGKDERIGIEPFYQGVEFYYLYLKTLTDPPISTSSSGM